MSITTPTQVRRPWRATVRTTFAVVVALAAMLPLLVGAAGVDETLPPIAGALAIATAITRIMALPAVDDFLAQFLPWLAADPPPRVGFATALDLSAATPRFKVSVTCHICRHRLELPITSDLWGSTAATDLASVTVTAPATREFSQHMDAHRTDGSFLEHLLEHADQLASRATFIRGNRAPE